MNPGARFQNVYVAVIIILLGVLAIQNLPTLFEQRATVRGSTINQDFELRMLSSGDLIFQMNDFLPLASYRDYWGDMTVTDAEWQGSSTVIVTMSDGTRLTVTLGSIDVTHHGTSR